MHRESFFKKAGIIFLIICMLISSPAMVSADSLKDAKKEKENLENALNEAKELVSDLKDSKSDIKSKVTQLDAKLTKISTDITNLEAQLETKNTEISDAKEVLAQAKEDERTQYKNMKVRIQYMYENSRTSYVEQLISAGSFSEFINIVEYIREMSAYDRAMLEKYQKAQESVTVAKEELEKEKSELEEMQKQVEEEKQAVQTLLSAKESELVSVNQNLKEASSQADAYAAEIEAQNDIIAQIQQAEAAKKAAREKARAEAEAKAKAEAEAKAKAEQEQENSTEMPGEEETESTENTSEVSLPEDTYNGGAFIWPCPSSTRVTSEYGQRISPTAGASSNHKGIDIGASYGADIVAVADGTVVFSGYSNTGGNYVMIDHGGSLYTVYMHASSLCVEKGATVTRGQVIAKVGSTGISTGNHLHFGVSLNGSYVSPWNYLSK